MNPERLRAMLQITGKCLDVTVEQVNPPQGSPFESTTIHLLVGSGASTKNEGVRVGRDFPRELLPKRDEDVTLNVVVTAFATRGGAGYRLTALSRANVKVPAGV